MSDEAATQTLTAMVCDAGGHVGSICVGTSAEGHRGVFAIAPIRAGELLLSVPRTLILHPRLPADDSSASAPYEELRLMLLLRKHAKNAPSSDKLAGWLEMLPSEFHLPTEWPDAELSLLGCASLEGAIREERGELVEAFSRIEEGGSLPGLGLAEYLWAASAVASRSAHLAEVEHKSGVPAMVPFGDMFNHLPSEAPAHALFDAAAGTYQYHALHAVDAGEQVWLSYGSHDDSVLLRCYGFVPTANPHRRCELALGLDGLPPAHREWAAEHGLDCEQHVEAEGASWALMGAARLLSARKDEIERGGALTILEGEAVSPRCEARALGRLLELARARLGEVEGPGVAEVEASGIASELSERGPSADDPRAKRRRGEGVGEGARADAPLDATTSAAARAGQLGGGAAARSLARAFREAQAEVLRAAIASLVVALELVEEGGGSPEEDPAEAAVP